MSGERAPLISRYLENLNEVPGWFNVLDGFLFTAIDAHQRDHGVRGDLLEIGVYEGRSAVLLGWLTRDDESLVVCDIFEEPAPTAETEQENQRLYPGLARQRFEANYRRYHEALPTIIAAASGTLSDYEPAASFRLAHIDGGHSYDVVRDDIANCRRLLAPGGVVVLDDWRSAHTPGVAAAIWEEVVTGGMVPITVNDQKLYATWSPAGAPTVDDIASWVAETPLLHADTFTLALEVEDHCIRGHTVVRIVARVGGRHDAVPPRERRVRWRRGRRARSD